jgi:hypothetical protein
MVRSHNNYKIVVVRTTILYINSLRPSVCLSNEGFGGWGRERPVKQRATSVSLWRGLDHHDFCVQTVSTKHCSRPKGRNDGRIASLSHHTRGGYKNLPPPPPHYRKNRRLYRGVCFQKFPKLSGTKVQNVKTGVLGFLTSGKGVNTRTDNLRVHTTGSDTHITSIRTTARLGWLEWCSHGCPKVTGTTSKKYVIKIIPISCNNLKCLMKSHIRRGGVVTNSIKIAPFHYIFSFNLCQRHFIA